MKPYAQVRWHTEMVGQLPRLLSVLFGGLWGFLFVVMIGLVDQSGELVKAFVPVLTALTGAGLGILASRSLSDHNFKREQHRSAFAAVLNAEGLVRALNDILDGLAELKALPGTDDEEKFDQANATLTSKIGVAWLSVFVVSREQPNFNISIETEADQEAAYKIGRVYSWLSMVVTSSDIQEEFRDDTKKLFLFLLMPTICDGISVARESLKDSARHFRDKL